MILFNDAMKHFLIIVSHQLLVSIFQFRGTEIL